MRTMKISAWLARPATTLVWFPGTFSPQGKPDIDGPQGLLVPATEVPGT